MTKQIALLVTVMCTASLLYVYSMTYERKNILLSCLSPVGKASLSIFLWHQVLIAFMYYSVLPRLSWVSFLVFSAILALFAFASYVFIEKPLNRIREVIAVKKAVILCVIICLIVSCMSFAVYRKAGVIREVPELGITTSDIHRGMHAEYNNRVYQWDIDFSNDGKIKVMICGDSFGRDWANILNESDVADKLCISYMYPPKDGVIDEAHESRLSEADFVFYAVSGDFSALPKWLTECSDAEIVYVVGVKNFGSSNGIVYAQRDSSDYFNTTVVIDDLYYERNDRLKELFGKHYIDMLLPVECDGRIRVFTEDGKFISQDCNHLTIAGAKWYSEKIDFYSLFDVQPCRSEN